MTRYLTGQPFSVPMTGRDPKTCEHGFLRSKDGSCVFCGATAAQVALDHAAWLTRVPAPPQP